MSGKKHVSRTRFETDVLNRAMDEDEFKIFIKERELDKTSDELKRAVYTVTARKLAVEIASIVERLKENDVDLIGLIDAELSTWPMRKRSTLTRFMLEMAYEN